MSLRGGSIEEHLSLSFHGAARTVTGSCMALNLAGCHILIDCGMFQGSRTLEALNREPFPFDARTVHGVILTHAHIDHSGLLPKLAAEGFAGPIWCTAPTRDLLSFMLPDSGRIQEHDAERRNRRPDRAGEDKIEPAYTEADAQAACGLTRPVPLGQWFEPAAGIRARLWNAGHILGSASVEIEAAGVRLLFSGDLGPEHKAFYADPAAPAGFDHVVCESTYGDRTREDITIEQRRTLLEAEIKEALSRGGNLVIPVFALERTQELLLDVASLMNSGRLPLMQLFVDSPLAGRATDVFSKYSGDLEDLGSGEIFRHPGFHFVESAAESMRLNDVSGAIIMAASGMCEGGRIRHHLLHNLARPDSTILFVGFQAAGTLGRIILDGAQRVRMSGQDVAVRAQVRRIDSYSAHGDRGDLRAWIMARAPIAGTLFLTHGESGAIKALKHDLHRVRAAAAIVVPELGECYDLAAGVPARRVAEGRVDLKDAVEQDWQNDFAQFSTQLKQQLRQIEGASARRQAVDRMRAVLESYPSRRGYASARGKQDGDT
jgi:metallo-beta-lactamase family protein